jgi:hypothetical protein
MTFAVKSPKRKCHDEEIPPAKKIKSEEKSSSSTSENKLLVSSDAQPYFWKRLNPCITAEDLNRFGIKSPNICSLSEFIDKISSGQITPIPLFFLKHIHQTLQPDDEETVVRSDSEDTKLVVR